MEEPSVAVEDVESEEIADHFLCCICLDLLYKPVVLSCGHISCFWCVHMSMSGHRESHCPICRCPYLHFPSICRLLHFLLVKMYPDTYKRREKQVLAEERRTNNFSPQFDAHLLTPYGNKELNVIPSPESCKTDVECNPSVADSASKSGAFAGIEQTVEESTKSHTQSAHGIDVVADEADCAPGTNSSENKTPISISDVLCSSCKQILIRPVVLNCGDVYCQSCLGSLGTEKLKCQECQSYHPGKLPNVCLELDHFLQEHFFDEYASRRSTVQPEQSTSFSGDSTAGPADISGSSEENNLFDFGDIREGVGCDYCGMYPIIGDSYRCQDCVERIGFDLCKSCHDCYSERPGRFNQNHKSDHKFILINREAYLRIRLSLIQQMGDNGGHLSFSSSLPTLETEEAVEETELGLRVPPPEDEDDDDAEG